MSILLVISVSYAVCGAITLAFVVQGLRTDPDLKSNWDRVEQLVGRWPIVLSLVVMWPYVAWHYRAGPGSLR